MNTLLIIPALTIVTFVLHPDGLTWILFNFIASLTSQMHEQLGTALTLLICTSLCAFPFALKNMLKRRAILNSSREVVSVQIHSGRSKKNRKGGNKHHNHNSGHSAKPQKFQNNRNKPIIPDSPLRTEHILTNTDVDKPVAKDKNPLMKMENLQLNATSLKLLETKNDKIIMELPKEQKLQIKNASKKTSSPIVKSKISNKSSKNVNQRTESNDSCKKETVQISKSTINCNNSFLKMNTTVNECKSSVNVDDADAAAGGISNLTSLNCDSLSQQFKLSPTNQRKESRERLSAWNRESRIIVHTDTHAAISNSTNKNQGLISSVVSPVERAITRPVKQPILNNSNVNLGPLSPNLDLQKPLKTRNCLTGWSSWNESSHTQETLETCSLEKLFIYGGIDSITAHRLHSVCNGSAAALLGLIDTDFEQLQISRQAAQRARRLAVLRCKHLMKQGQDSEERSGNFQRNFLPPVPTDCIPSTQPFADSASLIGWPLTVTVTVTAGQQGTSPIGPSAANPGVSLARNQPIGMLPSYRSFGNGGFSTTFTGTTHLFGAGLGNSSCTSEQGQVSDDFDAEFFGPQNGEQDSLVDNMRTIAEQMSTSILESDL